MSFITMQQMYQSWQDIINRVEQVTAKLDAGIDVADADTLAELEAIKTAINGTLSVQDADMLAELTAVKAKLEAIEQRLDETLDVKLTGSKLEELQQYPRVGNINPGQISVMLDTDKPYRLQYLEWACNSLNRVRLVIHPKDLQYPLQCAITTNGNTNQPSIRPDNILNHYSGWWDILEFNESTNQYKFRCRLAGMEFPNGVEIYFENTGTSVQTAGAILIGGFMS